METDQDAYNELCYYTLPLGDPAFIHQHVVDAFAVQTAGGNDKPIKVVFALVGLFLYVEKQFSGRQARIGPHETCSKKAAMAGLCTAGQAGRDHGQEGTGCARRAGA